MSERDAFEVRFHAAVRGYVGRLVSDLDPAELAHRIVAAEPRRRGLAAELAWRGLAVPRVAWILLLLAALITAMAAALFVGSHRPVTVFACPPESTPDTPGPVGQARPVRPETVAFDRRAGRLVVVADSGNGIETWTFDVCTNTWTRMHPNREPPSFTFRPLVYDVESDLTVGVASGPDGAPPEHVWVYDLRADSWTEKGVAPAGAALRAYDPVSGRIIADGSTQGYLSTYDIETDTWTPVHLVSGPDVGPLAYDFLVDRIIALGSPRGSPAWLADIRTGMWSRSGVATPVVELNWAVPSIAYDEAAERTVIAGSSGWAAYDAGADRWEVLTGAGRSMANPLAYDPVNRRLIGLSLGGIAVQGDVVAFDLVTREWTVLLEPSQGQAAQP